MEASRSVSIFVPTDIQSNRTTLPTVTSKSKNYTTRSSSPDYYCGINYSCGIGRCYRKRKLFILITAMLFLLSFLPFIYLTLLPTGLGKWSSTDLPQSQSAPIVPSATFEGDEKKHNEPTSNIHAGSSGIITDRGKTFIPENEQSSRQKAVVEACKHAWSGYEKFAWGRDELLPISKRGGTWFNLGLTLVDSLDTLWMMDLKKEFLKARNWVASTFTADVPKEVNLFETTIRVLGGLLSAYNLSNDTMFLTKATDLGNRLLPAFTSRSPVPYSDVNLHTMTGKAPRWGPDSSTSEVSSIQLEFKELTRLTGKPTFLEKSLAVSKHIKSLSKTEGLVPYFINAETGRFRGNTLTLGARADSYYEYLLKQYIQTNFTEPTFKQEFEAAVHGITNLLTHETKVQHLAVVGESNSRRFSPKMDHLVCFYPGVLALASINGFEPREWYIGMAANITRTCYEMYRVQPTGLAPEISHFRMVEETGSPKLAEDNSLQQDLFVKPLDKHYLLRPETVESLFYMFRITGNTMYQDWGWKIFQSIEKYAKIPTGGYSSIGNVLDPKNLQYKDKMESFFIGETLKYLFLLFDDSKTLLPLDKYVFNTEAHPLPIFKPDSTFHGA